MRIHCKIKKTLILMLEKLYIYYWPQAGVTLNGEHLSFIGRRKSAIKY